MDDKDTANQTGTRDQLALNRTQLANERTVLAYVRTSLLLAATGVTLLKFFPTSVWAIPISWMFICLGVAVLLVGLARFRRLSAELQKQFLND